MDILKGLTDPGWLAFALFFLGIIFFLAYNRQRESRRILNKFDEKDIVLTTFGANYFGLESEMGGPLRSSGALVLLKDAIYYRARYLNREIMIKGNSITYIGISDVHKDKPLYQNAVIIRFLNEEGKEEKAAFRMPYPNHWITAIRTNFLNKEAGKQN
ncbi:MAG: hypothetical protein GXP33_06765 [Spirochaetes bacterium]|nr:hypothetical protein [Spirochaetota bacterium]